MLGGDFCGRCSMSPAFRSTTQAYSCPLTAGAAPGFARDGFVDEEGG